jgi:hypothetical protein
MTEPMTHTLRSPGAVLHYDIRSGDGGTAGTDGLLALLIAGSPMGAGGFVALAGHFADRTVVTYDPRGAGRSPRTDGALRTEVEEHADDGSRADPLLGLNMLTCGAYQHDFDALRAGPSRVVIGVGEESGEAIAGRAGASIARRLGVTPVIFPGGHDGFAGGEFGRAGKPDAFAAVLREVLAVQ